MIDRLQGEFAFIQTALSLRHKRMELLASNIANADTPNYQARDFDFKQVLVQALGRTDGGLPAPTLTLTSDKHIAGAGNAHLNFQPQYRVPHQASMDGNTVEMDLERMAFAENTSQHQASLSFAGSSIQRLMAALQPT